MTNYASTLIKLERVKKSLPLFEKSLQLEPDNVKTINNYVNGLIKLGKSVESFPFLRVSLQGIIDDANYLIKLGKTQESLPWFEQVLELEPDNTDVISCPDN
ncbi:tetratricopeptide repeat protein [Okeania hirsuta]|uniref:Tetratricopeptide repeat protein n=1 Tax=Okeania hirsuta TaxID=1458930 RepID=A0A3N6PJ50_9CYAN|nr:tetratricopeptide repeat protein [Okeania hirsuta]RQH39572.1 tetratricopeptide repeat protein [Okeania hirsuta]